MMNGEVLPESRLSGNCQEERDIEANVCIFNNNGMQLIQRTLKDLIKFENKYGIRCHQEIPFG